MGRFRDFLERLLPKAATGAEPVRAMGVVLLTLYLLSVMTLALSFLLSSWAYLDHGCQSNLAEIETTVEPPSMPPHNFAPSGTQPRLRLIEPKTGVVSGGTPILIRGTGFSEVVTVKFGNLELKGITPESSTLIRVSTPSHSAGQVPVTVANGTAVSEPQVFSFQPRQSFSVKAISPESGPLTGGSRVVIMGSGFPEKAMVFFDGRPATEVSGKGSRIMARTPPHQAGPANLEVRSSDGGSAMLQAQYVFTCPDAYERRLFGAVLLAGILGACLHALRSLYWYVGTRTLVRSWILMYVLLPATGSLIACAFYLIARAGFYTLSGKGNLLMVGLAVLVGMFSRQATEKLKDIADGLLTKASTGTDQAPAVPPQSPSAAITTPGFGLTSVDPELGSIHGGENVLLTGQGLSAGDAVTFDNAVAPVQFANPTHLMVKSPRHDSGRVDVTVKNPLLQVSTRPKAFVYTPVSPASGSRAGNTQVTITGANFTGNPEVTFDNSKATNVQVVDSTTLKATTPSSVKAGIVRVKVTLAGQTLLDVPEAFKYTP